MNQPMLSPVPAAAGDDPLLQAAMAGVTVIDLAQTLENGIPCSPNHPGFKMALLRRHGDAVRPGGLSAANEMIVTGGHVGTHIDALSHASYLGCLHGGHDAEQAQRGGRFSMLGVEHIPPIVRRGVLLDVAGAHGVARLPGGHGIGAADLELAVEYGGVRPQPGDVCLVRTGWASLWGDPVAYIGHDSGVPGMNEQGGRWCVEHGAFAVGGDTTALEQVWPGQGHRVMPVHRLLLCEHGVYIIEHMNLEPLAAARHYRFLFVLAPLKMVGATGSPVRPLAVLSAGGGHA
jgi:kynurenine formamidase